MMAKLICRNYTGTDPVSTESSKTTPPHTLHLTHLPESSAKRLTKQGILCKWVVEVSVLLITPYPTFIQCLPPPRMLEYLDPLHKEEKSHKHCCPVTSLALTLVQDSRPSLSKTCMKFSTQAKREPFWSLNTWKSSSCLTSYNSDSSHAWVFFLPIFLCFNFSFLPVSCEHIYED